MSDRIRVKRSMYRIHRNSRFDGSIPRLAHRYSSLLCRKAFDFNWASRRESARTRYARGILDFRKNQVYAGGRGTARMRGREEGEGIHPDGVSGARRLAIEIEWMYISVEDLCPQSTSNRRWHWFYFIFDPRAQQIFLPPPPPPPPPPPLVPIYRSCARLRLSRLNETVLCDSINSAKRKTSGRERKKGRDGGLIRLVASGYGSRDHLAGIFSSYIIKLINTCYSDTRNRSTSAGIADTTRIVYTMR